MKIELKNQTLSSKNDCKKKKFGVKFLLLPESEQISVLFQLFCFMYFQAMWAINSTSRGRKRFLGHQKGMMNNQV